MSSRFPGFPPEALEFFRSLARHNNRDWFRPRKAVFEERVKQPMRQLVEALKGRRPDPARSHAPRAHAVSRCCPPPENDQ